jgi:hypothetical protein
MYMILQSQDPNMLRLLLACSNTKIAMHGLQVCGALLLSKGTRVRFVNDSECNSKSFMSELTISPHLAGLHIRLPH